MSTETKNVQVRIDFITDESRKFAGTILQTEKFNKELKTSQAELDKYRKELAKVGADETQRAIVLNKIADAEKKVAAAAAGIAAESKKVANIDLSKLTPAQLVERARQLGIAIRNIPQSAPQYAELNAELRQTNDQLSVIRDKAKGISDTGGGGGGILAKGAGIFAGITAFVGSVAGIVSATRETEKLFAVLRNSVGDTGAALKLFDEIQRFAATTPFSINEVVGAFTKLQQRNFNPTIDQLRAIGDIASSQGKSIDQFVEAVLDASTGEFERLKEFGIVARKEGDQVTATFRGQSQTFKLNSDNIKNYLLGLGQLPGILGATDSVAATLDGSLSNLGDNFDQLFATIGGGGGILKGVVDFFNQIVGSINSFLKQPLSDKLREQQSEFNALVNILKDVNVSEDTRNRAIAQLQRDYPDYIGNINLQKASEADLNKILESGNALFTKRVFLQSQNERLEKFAKNQMSFQKLIFDTEKRLQDAQNRPDSQRGFFDPKQADEIRGINNQLNSYRNTLAAINQEQQDFVVEQDKFAKQFGIDVTEQPSANTPTAPKSGPGAIKKDAQAAAGSLAYLREEIAKVQKEIENTPGDSKALAPLIEELRRAEAELKNLEDRIAQLKNPSKEVAPSLGDIAATFGQGPSGEVNLQDTEEQRAALVATTNDFIVQDEENTQFEIDEIRQEADRRDAERRERARLARKEALEIDAQEQRDLEIQGAEAVASVLKEVERNRIEQEKEEALAALDQEYDEKIRAAEGNSVLQQQLQKELERKKQAIELEAARKRKALALKEAVIQGALAVVKALPNVAAAIAAGIAAAAQIAIISSQKLARGGAVKFGVFGGNLHSQGGNRGVFEDGTQVEVERGEAFAVVNRKNAPMLRFLSAVNSYGGNGVPFFRKGGVMRFDTGGLPAINTTPASNYTSASPAGQGIMEINGFLAAVKMFGQIVDQFPRVVQAQVSYLALEEKAAELEKVRSDAGL